MRLFTGLISNMVSPGGVFVMGAIAGLICSPCTTAPLSAILLYIAQSGNMWLGGGTLYLYALGMGLPLMLITVFGNRLLPKRLTICLYGTSSDAGTPPSAQL